MLAGTGVAPQGAKCAVLRLNVTFTQPMNPQQAYFDDAFFVRTGTTGAFYSVTQCRLVDTRGPSGPYGGPRFGPGDARTFGIAGNCGIPTQATAIAANLTVTNETGAGYFVVYPAGTTKPPTSTLNFAPSRTRANNAILQLGVGGQLVVLNAVPIGGSSDLILDVTGYFQ